MERERIARYALVGWFIVGLLIGVIMIFHIKPWTPELGVTFSPARQIYDMVWCLLVFPPTIIYYNYWFSKHPEWLAPRGKYVPGTKYSLVSPYSLISAVIFAALAVVAGTTTFAGLDLAMAVWGLACPLIGVFSTTLACGIAYVLRGLLGLLPFPLPCIFGHAFWEMSTFAFGSAFYYWLIERTGKRNVLNWAIWVTALNVYHGFAALSAFFWAFAWDAYIPFFVYAWVGYRPGAVVATVIGLIVAEAIIRSIKTRAKR